jgi:phenylalanyl-tRNA synthetase beta chain
MKFSERWLRTFVDPPIDTAGLCDRLTMTGLEVEDAVPAVPAFSGVVVARIESVVPHPNADRLRVCTVDVGTATSLSIVCGAPNAAAGMKVPCALVDAQLPGDLAIRETTVSGVASQGMLCSAQELVSPTTRPVCSSCLPMQREGECADSALDDTPITLKFTPNRADCH